MMQIALSLPKLEVLRTEVRALGEDCWRVRFAVANAGYLPAYISKRALERKTARGVVFNIHLPPGLSLVSGVERIMGQRRQLEVGFVAGVTEQVELFAVGDSDGGAFGKLHGRSPGRLQGVQHAQIACDV